METKYYDPTYLLTQFSLKIDNVSFQRVEPEILICDEKSTKKRYLLSIFPINGPIDKLNLEKVISAMQICGSKYIIRPTQMYYMSYYNVIATLTQFEGKTLYEINQECIKEEDSKEETKTLTLKQHAKYLIQTFQIFMSVDSSLNHGCIHPARFVVYHDQINVLDFGLPWILLKSKFLDPKSVYSALETESKPDSNPVLADMFSIAIMWDELLESRTPEQMKTIQEKKKSKYYDFVAALREKNPKAMKFEPFLYTSLKEILIAMCREEPKARGTYFMLSNMLQNIDSYHPQKIKEMLADVEDLPIPSEKKPEEKAEPLPLVETEIPKTVTPSVIVPVKIAEPVEIPIPVSPRKSMHDTINTLCEVSENGEIILITNIRQKFTGEAKAKVMSAKVPRQCTVMVTQENQMFGFGGRISEGGSDKFVSDIVEISPKRDKVETCAMMLDSRVTFGIINVDDEIFCLGGYSNYEHLSRCEAFSIIECKSTAIPAFERAKIGVSVCYFASIGERWLYAFGGGLENITSLAMEQDFYKKIDRLNLDELSKWEVIEYESDSYNGSSMSGSFQIDENSIIVFGGQVNPESFGFCSRSFIFDTSDNTFKMGPEMLLPDAFSHVYEINKCIVALSFPPIKETIIHTYDTQNKIWNASFVLHS